MLDWMEDNLAQSSGTDRKFIIQDHVYAGARFEAEQMWHTKQSERFFSILLDFSSQIVLEVAGHEHITDLRYHGIDDVLDTPNSTN